jgi:rhodanese-related sulfurtransferase
MLGASPAADVFSLAVTMVSSPSYAGDLSAAETWDRLIADPKAQLIDVRTMAEWNFVGVPDLSDIDRDVHCIEWAMFPQMNPNTAFVAEAAEAVRRAGADASTPVFLLCRSGARSRAAATALTAAGFTAAYNVAGGFEGDPDSERHRGRVNGWKAAGLPWRQS